jgi:ATP-dependent DNA helicase RecG
VVDLSEVGEGIRRYARNPRIVRVCFDLRLCQELGEGIRRMFDEMRRAGLVDPLYRQDIAGVTLTLSAAPMNALLDKRFPSGWREIVAALRDRKRMSTAELADVVRLSRPAVRSRLNFLETEGVIVWRGKSTNDPRAYWCLPEEDESN